ncbi:MAG: flagellar hook-length control protein FliK [Proteobacteria bacterium]|nr:flagellar hook-length control protein FliK [Pseudomonadota bacterium]
MASEAVSTPRPQAPELEQSSWMARRAQLEKSGLGLDASGDAFAQIFANIQADKPERQKPATREIDSNSDQPTPRMHPWHEHKVSKPDKEDHAADDDKTVASDNTSAPHPKAESKKAEKKPSQTDDSQPLASNDAEECTTTPEVAVSETTDTQEIPADIQDMADADPATQQANDSFKLALGLAVTAQSTESTSACKENIDEGKEQTAAAGETALTGLLSFRANPGIGHETAGKKPVAEVTAAPEEIGADSTPLQIELKKPGTDLPASEEAKHQPNSDLPPAQSLAGTGQKPEDFHLLMKDWIETKKESREQPVSSPAPAEKTEVQTDTTNGLTAPPAAGSRVNALLGFSAPAPAGSGGGSPSPAAKAVGTGVIEGMGSVGLAQGTSGSLENAANIQLVRAPRGLANLPPSEQVGVTLARMARAGIDRFDLQLHPADLGKVDIRLEINQDGLVRATVTADNPATYDLLQKDSRALEKVLEQAGLQTDAGSLSFNLREEGQAQGQANDSSDTPAWKRWPEKTPSVDEVSQVSAYAVAPGRVDLTI